MACQAFAGMAEGTRVTWSHGGDNAKYSPVDSLMSSLNGSGQILYGRVPLVYEILNLTDEQMQAITDLCKAAQKEKGTRQQRTVDGDVAHGPSRPPQRADDIGTQGLPFTVAPASGSGIRGGRTDEHALAAQFF